MNEIAQELPGGESVLTDPREAIVTEHEEAMLRYATRLLRCPHLAQDAVQNVFIRLFRSWQDGWTPSERMRAWLFRATHNEAVDLIRKESRRRDLHGKAAREQTEACADGIHCQETDETRRQRVLESLGRLHPREQQVVLLRLEDGLSYAEIARITGRSEGNVGNILHHAVVKLSRQMKKTTSEATS